ncbi:MAG: zinc-dependent metalloprotease [Bradymonadales bacterium]|nr:zinc-dependent metalloprotease [Bradymonadales bacterium]
MRQRRHALMGLLCLWLGLAALACAQQVGDIDRTQPNRILKTDLDGVWYMMETVTYVPPHASVDFIGDTSYITERIRWVVEEDYLIAYRNYPLTPGADNVDGDFNYDEPDYHEQPVAVFPILGHFDIKREYNSSTGEEMNVISENSSDRPWFERDYMRVDWSNNLITNFNFVADWWWWTPIELTYQVDTEREDVRSLYFEREGDQLVYFDIPRRMLVEPDLWECAYSWWGWGWGDCTAAEVEVVASFARTPEERDYESLPYDDRMIQRYGFFRSQRYVYDQQRGFVESAISKVIQRLNIWQQTYRRDNQGNFLRDTDGNRIPIPMAERQPRTIPYYVSESFPDDELILNNAFAAIEEWNVIFQETVAIAKGIDVSEVPDILVGCHTPVVEADPDACGEVGFSPRFGDARYSTLWWVEADQMYGPLGYGPCAADPVTGEIISSKAHVYAGGLNTYASLALDMIRLINGDLDPQDLVHADHVREAILDRAEESTDIDRVADSLRDMPLGAWRERERERLNLREARRRELRSFDPAAADQRINRARELGFSSWTADSSYWRNLASQLNISPNELTQDLMEAYDPIRLFNPVQLERQRRRRMEALARGVDFIDFVDPNVVGYARTFAGRTDYDQIWREIRANTFLATAIHEIGHTLGLRHNFSGSYDSMNYHDEYWDLREPTLFEPQSMADLYQLTALTEDQINGRMREYQYSSIMDYGLTFTSDTHGAGRYDRAAIVFGYTGGTIAKPVSEMADGCGPDTPGTMVDPTNSSNCLVLTPGFIEVYDKGLTDLGDAGEILSSQDEFGFYFEDLTSLVVPYLERWHYTTVMQSFPDFEDAFDRQWMRLADYLAAREIDMDNRPVRVPYLFCPDEWVGSMVNCNYWDGGADPFEAARNVIDDYRAMYYFRDFKRDRIGWWPGNSFYSYWYYVFGTLSDYYQNWYLAPWGYDDVLDDYFWLAVNMGLNLFAEAMATPEYGTFCTQPNGRLFHLSDQAGTSPETTSEYYMDAYCDPDGTFYEVPQGYGRRRFTRYDVMSGFNYGNYELETGHVWTSMAAMLALVDPYAFVIGTEGDIGTYAISFIDYFGEEIFDLVNAMLTENYAVHSPVLEVTETNGDNPSGVLRYPIISAVWDPETSSLIDPATGILQSELLGPSRARTGICQPCVRSDECNGYTGGGYGVGGVFCVQGIDSDNPRQGYCIYDCYEMPANFCGDDFVCSPGAYWCLPEEGLTCEEVAPACSSDAPNGSCPEGETCEDGECVDLWPIVESDTSLSQVDDIVFWGMLYSTFGWETRYNDQMFVFKRGTAEEVTPGPQFETVTFTDPIMGDEYGANQEVCNIETIEGGPIGICSECEVDEDCVGYIGDYYGGVFCVEMEPGVSYCLQDCSEPQDEDVVPEQEACDYLSGYVCEYDVPWGYACVPPHGPGAEASCRLAGGDCSEAFPAGDCEEGTTCVDGECVELQAPSIMCRVGWSRLPGGAQLITRGNYLVDRMNEALTEWAYYDGDDEDEETRLYLIYLRYKYAVEFLMSEINTIRAIYEYFGKVY